MLKIKDNVDLKELEKYGFEYKIGYYEKYFKNGKYLINIIANKKRIITFYKKVGFYLCVPRYSKIKPRKRLIKDLIKNCLVEKVEV